MSAQLGSSAVPSGGRPGGADTPSPSSTSGDATPGATNGAGSGPTTTPRRTPPGLNQTDFVTVRPVGPDGTPGRPTTVPRSELQSNRPANDLDAGDTATFNGQQVQVGGNNIRITTDANGHPTGAQLDVSERFTANDLRLPNRLNHQANHRISDDGRFHPEVNAQRATTRAGNTGTRTGRAPNYPWSGGHIGGHQFFPDLGRVNMFPQELYLNTNGGYRQMELAISNTAGDPTSGITASAHVTLTPGQSATTPRRQPVPARIQVEVTFTGPNGTVTRQYDFNNAPANQQTPRIRAYDGRDDARQIVAQIG